MKLFTPLANFPQNFTAFRLIFNNFNNSFYKSPVKSTPCQLMFRFSFTRVRGVYVVCSLVASLLIFRTLSNLIIKKGNGDYVELSRMSLRPVPEAKLNPKQEPGRVRGVESHPLPSTSLECFGSKAADRTCKARNMCYSPDSDKFFAVGSRGNHHLKQKWMKAEDGRLLDTTTVNDHNVFYFDFEEDPGFAADQVRRSGNRIRFVEKKTFAFSRFVFNNVMHNLHDDFLGQYWLHKQHAGLNADNYIFFLDESIEAPFDHLFATLTSNPFLYRAELKERPGMEVICFDELIIGNSKEATWYDYGFFAEPQGPIGGDKKLDGFKVREAADFLLKYYGIDWVSEAAVLKTMKRVANRKPTDSAPAFYISIFSRTKDRLILNEADLVKELERRFGLPVRLVQLEKLAFNEILQIMSRTLIAVGLHGSALIFAMFMPRHAILLEMFPYSTPAENYLPYQTLALLPGVDLNYRTWSNRNAAMNFAQFGQRKQLEGLTADQLINLITLKTVPPHICCGNLAWNFKIYQDTIVDVGQVTSLIREAVKETPRDRRRLKKAAQVLEMSRHRIGAVSYDLHSQDRFLGKEVTPMRLLIVQWNDPWAGNAKIGVKPSQYGIWVEELVDEVISKDASFYFHTCVAGTDVNFWIRPYYFDEDSKQHLPAAPYSSKFQIKCT